MDQKKKFETKRNKIVLVIQNHALRVIEAKYRDIMYA